MVARALLIAAALACQASPDLRKKADSIRPTAAELRFLKIPWVTDPFAGFETARKEGRPVFLYVITGDALEDC